MGDAMLGRDAAVKLSTTTVLNLYNWTLEPVAEGIRQATFGSVYGKVHGLGTIDWAGSFEGLYDVDDATGQMVFENAMISGTKITDVRFYLNATKYVHPDLVLDADAGIFITRAAVTATQGDVIRVTYDYEGTGKYVTTTASG